MTTLKDMEDNLKTFIIQEQSDAHNVKTVNTAKYNNIKIVMDVDDHWDVGPYHPYYKNIYIRSYFFFNRFFKNEWWFGI